ncbi:MAG: hypothetical protein ACYS0I_09195 [Planctomycetota bacterium]|jgi:type II secretory pathway pseudopilin PulG
MEKRQKAILIEFIAVIVITAVAVVALINFRDWINHSEAVRAMQHLSQVVLQYRETHGSVPPQSWIDEQRENLPGNVRLGGLHYRARWIDFESPPDTILAYTEKKYHSLFLGDGFIVLRLSGNVEWMETQLFQNILAGQQSTQEIEAGREDSL